jgi:hypothetical protein
MISQLVLTGRLLFTNPGLGMQTGPFPAIGKQNAVTQDLYWPVATFGEGDFSGPIRPERHRSTTSTTEGIYRQEPVRANPTAMLAVNPTRHCHSINFLERDLN